MQKESFVNGFLKQAESKGYLDQETSTFLKKHAEEAFDSFALNKQALMGEGGDLDRLVGGLLASNALGGMVGSTYSPISDRELKEELEYSENPSISKALKYLIPGYGGYRLAKNRRLETAHQKYLDDRRADNM